MTTLEKLEQLTHYIQMKNGEGDVVLDTTLDKLLAREEAQYAEWLAYLESQFAAFEAEYGLDSAVFYERYERGEMGDEMDFVEWAGLYDIYLRSQTKLGALHPQPELSLAI